MAPAGATTVDASLSPLPGLYGDGPGNHELRLARLSSNRAPPVATARRPSGAERSELVYNNEGRCPGLGELSTIRALSSLPEKLAAPTRRHPLEAPAQPCYSGEILDPAPGQP